MRLGTAGFVGPNIEKFKRPAKTLELYEFQACPFCRKVGIQCAPSFVGPHTQRSSIEGVCGFITSGC